MADVHACHVVAWDGVCLRRAGGKSICTYGRKLTQLCEFAILESRIPLSETIFVWAADPKVNFKMSEMQKTISLVSQNIFALCGRYYMCAILISVKVVTTVDV